MSQVKRVSKSAVSGSGDDPGPAGMGAAAGGPERRVVEPGETARSAGPPAAAARAIVHSPENPTVPDPEVVPKAQRRRFTAQYKLQILRQTDAMTEPGQIGELLRREGLYSSSLTEWRRLRDQGFLASAGARKRGRKPKPVDPQTRRVAELERENRKLQEELRKARVIIDFQKKVQDLLRLQDDEEAKQS